MTAMASITMMARVGPTATPMVTLMSISQSHDIYKRKLLILKNGLHMRCHCKNGCCCIITTQGMVLREWPNVNEHTKVV